MLDHRRETADRLREIASLPEMEEHAEHLEYAAMTLESEMDPHSDEFVKWTVLILRIFAAYLAD